MHFFRARASNHPHNLSASGSPNDGIVNQHNSLSFQNAAHRVQLHLDPEMSNRGLRLDERAADVMIADEPHPQRNVRFVRIAHRGANP